MLNQFILMGEVIQVTPTHYCNRECEEIKLKQNNNIYTIYNLIPIGVLNHLVAIKGHIETNEVNTFLIGVHITIIK